MTNKFEDRLKAAAQRVQAAKQSAEDERERRRRTEEAQVAKIDDALKAWKDRIVPAIVTAIAEANKIIRDAKVQLTSSVSPSHTISFGRVGPPIPSLPIMIVGARSGALPKATLAAQLAGSGRRQQQIKATLNDFARSPRLQFGINHDGKVWISPQNYSSKTSGVMEVNEFEKETAENAIAEFVEVVTRSEVK